MNSARWSLKWEEEGAGASLKTRRHLETRPNHATPEQRSLMPWIGEKSCICSMMLDPLWIFLGIVSHWEETKIGMVEVGRMESLGVSL
jgi:hypothetical protein